MNATTFDLRRSLGPYPIRSRADVLRGASADVADDELEPRFSRARRLFSRMFALAALGALVFGVAVSAQGNPAAVTAVTDWATFGVAP